MTVEGVDAAAESRLRTLLRQHLGSNLADSAITVQDGTTDNEPATTQAVLQRRLEQEIPALLATEGYFSPRFALLAAGQDAATSPLHLHLFPGPLARIGKVYLVIDGLPETPAGQARLARLQQRWPLPTGAVFRQADWTAAKAALLRQLQAQDYPAAQLTGSRADVDPGTAGQEPVVHLYLSYASGPRYRLGPLIYQGLERHDPARLQHYAAGIPPGSPYDAGKLLAFQTALQNLPYFSSVVVQVPLTPEATTAAAGTAERTAPVRVQVRERAPHRAAFGAGISSNTGARVEASLRSHDLWHHAWELDGGIRLEQLRQAAHADIFLPLHDFNVRDSFGALREQSRIEGLEIARTAFAVQRSQQRGPVEMRLGANWQSEWQQASGQAGQTRRALTLNADWRWRQAGTWFNRRAAAMQDETDAGIDSNIGDEGMAARIQIGGAGRKLGSDQDFLRLYGRYQQSLALGRHDTLMWRWEGGTVLAPSRQGIPQDFLFRAGGSQSVRGYAYQSLGVKSGPATLGGRYLTTLSAEYTHWFFPAAAAGTAPRTPWGVALFADAGQAGDSASAMRLRTGIGLGLRWRTVAGPLAADVAWGEADRWPHLHFSLAIPF